MTFMPLRERLAELLRSALQSAQAAGELPPFDIPEPLPVEPARHAAHGDYGSPVCLGLARVVRRAPLQIAQTVIPHLPAADFVAHAEAVAPGYINFTLSEAWLAAQVAEVLAAGAAWGNVDLGKGKRVQVEFVSANPTGPITIGSARNAVIGDTVASVLSAAGYQVEREYYVNDAGSKARKLAVSVFNKYAELLGAPVPLNEETYPGAYITAMAESLVASAGRRYLEQEPETALREIMRWAIAQVLVTVEADLARLRVHFDTWRHERDFYAPAAAGQSSLFEQRLAVLREAGAITEKDGATWFTHPDLDKDAVLIRSAQVIPNPEDRPTYLASDAAYVWDKLVLRGFDRAIYVWGADHHGDVPRLYAVTKAQGLDPERVSVILYQMVTLLRGGEEVRMSKSSGEFVTLRDLVDEVGPDPIRFMMLTRTVDVTLDFDLDLVVEQSDRNPVFYVQYAHTRIAGVLRKAAELGLAVDTPGDLTLLKHPSELALIRKLLALPEVITLAAGAVAPHHLTLYATELGALFHAFYRDCRIADPDDLPLTYARLTLARAAKSVLARVLHLMGMDAPDRM